MNSRTRLRATLAFGLVALALAFSAWRWGSEREGDRRSESPAQRRVHSAVVAEPARESSAAAAEPDVFDAPSLQEPELTITGRVVDDADRPIVGAIVARTEAPTPEAEEARVETVAVDADGLFRFSAESDRTYALRATSLGFANAMTEGVRAGEHVVFRLAPGGTVFGRIVDAASRAPLAGFEIQAWSAAPHGYVSVDARTTSGADGTYRLTGVEVGRRSIHAERTSPPGSAFRSIEVSAGEPVEVNFLVPAPVRLHGRVVDAETGSPIVGAVVTGLGPVPQPVTKTGENGSFELRRFFHGNLDEVIELSAAAPGYATAGRRALVRPSDADVAVDIALERAAVLTGIVMDTAGAPAAGLDVDLVAEASEKSGLPPVRTDDDGRYRFEGVAPGIAWIVRVLVPWPPSSATSEPVVLARGEEREMAAIRVGEPISIEGRVFDSRGEPVADASVFVFLDGPDSTRAPGDPFYTWSHSADDGRFTVRFRLAPSATESVKFLLSASREGATRSPDAFVDARPGAVVRGVELRVGVGFPLDVVVAHADDTARRPAPRGTVALRRTSDEVILRSSVHLDSMGRCRLDGIPAGTYRLALESAKGLGVTFESVEREVEVPSDEPVLLLVDSDDSRDASFPAPPAWGRVHFLVLDAESGEEIPLPVFIVLGSWTGNLGEYGTPDDGFLFPVAPGSHLVSARGLDHLPAPPVAVDVPPGGVAGPITLFAPRGIAAEGVLRLADGSPAAFVTVAIDPPSGEPAPGTVRDPRRQAISDADGRFVVRGLRPGRHVVSIDATDDGPVRLPFSRDVVIAPGEPLEILVE